MARNRDCQAANYAKRGLITARRPADLYASGCSVLVAVTFPDQVVL